MSDIEYDERGSGWGKRIALFDDAGRHLTANRNFAGPAEDKGKYILAIGPGEVGNIKDERWIVLSDEQMQALFKHYLDMHDSYERGEEID